MADAILAVSGIYAIRNTINGKAYVGSAVKVSRRWARHRTDLATGIHHSAKLQRAWSKYGADRFEFVVLEVVDGKAGLIEREQYWIDKLNAFAGGYNTTSTAGNCLGVTHGDDVRQKVREKALQQWADPVSRAILLESRKGRTQSEETRAKMSAAHMGIAKGRKQSAETIEKRKQTIRDRVAAGLITLARVMTPEHKAKLLANAMSPEARKKRSDALRGKAQPPELVKRRVESAKATKAATLKETAGALPNGND